MKSVPHMGEFVSPTTRRARSSKTGEVANLGSTGSAWSFHHRAKLSRDCGNVAYKDFLEQVAVPDPDKITEIFAHTRMIAEKAGDVIEFWL